MKNISLKCLGMLCLVLGSFTQPFFTGYMFAQDSNPLLTVRIVEVHHGKTAEFADLQKQLAEAREKAGLPGRWIWQEVRGNSSTFRIVTNEANFAEFGEEAEAAMSEADMATWISRITAITHHRDVVTVRLYPELEIKPKTGVEPNMLMLIQRTVDYRKSDAYQEWLTDKFFPHLRKQGETGWSAGKVAFGGNVNSWTLARHVSSWAELDEPGATARLSDKEREALFEGSNEVGGELSILLLRYRGDLSHNGPE